MRNQKVSFLTQAAMIAALYVVLTYLSSMFGLASGAIQFRLSEALTILPFFTPAAIPGLAIGCLLSNLLTGAAALDIVFGALATLLGALGSYALRRYKFAVTIPPVLANMVIVPWVLQTAYGITDGYPYLMFTVGVGEVAMCMVVGSILLTALNKYKKVMF